ncbi:hypothetical protein GCM10007424_17090 [Flavobacterium suaedae]|uniref:DUF1129 family protein n=1 Tax=Flavobacterium suaedae TaxID=1767027 RepID=A0ABQ1JWU0_9FLAO|nr:hypothetical protein [Flavobacterium suaedae]GGB77601.1 hypothetical protein GCM10007424_17090 [Flavobacterium suaedae]
MKLTAAQIGFIDNYLKNSGINYIDIRYEMVDHIATDLETKFADCEKSVLQDEDFQNYFKVYMAKNKAQFLTSNKQFAKTARMRAFKLILKNIVRPTSLLLTPLLFIILYKAIAMAGLETVKDILHITYTVLLIAVVLFDKINYKTKTEKFSVVDKMISGCLIGIYVVFVFIRPDKIISDSLWLSVYYTLFIAFITTGAITLLLLSAKYKKQYE